MDVPATTPAAGLPSLAELQRSICARVREFEVTALLDLLASMGYAASELEFRGHLSASPQPSLVERIEFGGSPGLGAWPLPHGSTQARSRVEPKVTITVNLGLLSCRSPLPSYLLRLCQELDTCDPVIELLQLLDRSLLRTRLTSDVPDRMLERWGDVRLDFLRIHGLDSPMGLHWLFRHVFPELGVRVRRITDGYRVPFVGARLGFSDLGRCAFGTSSRVTVHDLEVTLISTETKRGGEPWPQVADLRIRRLVLPLLDEVCMNLTVVFVLLDRSSSARLSPTSYVGYDPMARLQPQPPLPPTRIVLYRGALPHTEPTTDELEQARASGEDERLRLERSWRRGRHGIVELHLVYTPPGGRSYAYDVEVRWGARAWYAEEPFEMTLTFEGMPKANPDPRHHPNLWLWLRNEARTRVADLIAITATAETELDEPVSLELVERSIAKGDHERLYALLWSKLTPLDRWEAAAWQRFVAWSEG